MKQKRTLWMLAYPDFSKWAADRTKAKDWYKTAMEGKSQRPALVRVRSVRTQLTAQGFLLLIFYK